MRRAGVSAALKQFERQRLIAARRGAIQMIDRQGLITLSNGAYANADSAPSNFADAPAKVAPGGRPAAAIASYADLTATGDDARRAFS